MKTIQTEEITQALRNVGLQEGDIVLTHSDISRIGLIAEAKSREDILGAYHRAFCDVLDDSGTLLALACTESFAREQRPFDTQSSPSEQGVFSEYVRTLPGTIRSMHPIFSVCANGAKAKELCHGTSPASFGYDSPFGRLHRLGGKIVCIGVDLLAMTFVHYIEQSFGVPYYYNKEWTGNITCKGVPEHSRFFGAVRYLGCGIDFDFNRLQRILLEEGLAQRAPLGHGWVHHVSCNAVFDVVMRELPKDIFFLLKNPPKSEPWKGARIPGANQG
ncbi:MAG: AAC(3) family N-acetyltransferase, partial [Proteobacteria bacterium]|nr:AAC(3) family N-acetyltransferase [Pseudomonadota bacterium]